MPMIDQTGVACPEVPGGSHCFCGGDGAGCCFCEAPHWIEEPEHIRPSTLSQTYESFRQTYYSQNVANLTPDWGNVPAQPVQVTVGNTFNPNIEYVPFTFNAGNLAYNPPVKKGKMTSTPEPEDDGSLENID